MVENFTIILVRGFHEKEGVGQDLKWFKWYSSYTFGRKGPTTVTLSNDTKTSLSILLISLGLGLAFDFLFFGKLPGVSFPVYIVSVLAGLLVVARRQKQELPRSALFMMPLLLF